MDGDHDEMRFVCKLCHKRFPSGKSLGGHMRSHVLAASANSAESDDKFDQMDGNLNSNSYGLRENPKRSWRASSSSSTLPFPNERICKQCGKGFQSLKALCGHMAFHSDKDRSLKDYDYSWTSENLDHEDKLVVDSHSDTEESEENEHQDPVFITRSKAKRCKKVVIKPSSFSLTNTNSNNSNYTYGSSSVSEIDEFEQEEVAMCLMMLSKDSTNWAGVHSVLESSDNNSVVLEMKNSRKEWNLNKNDTKKVESGISVEGVVWNRMTGFNYRDLSYEEKQEIRRNLFREFGYNDNSLKKRIQDDDGEGSYKRNKYECLNCNKTFSSFQGLGGHRPCNKKNNAFNPGRNNEFARDQKAKLEKKIRAKKNKGHECPICFRMFKSGQALGGHRRSHFINGSEDRRIDDMARRGHAVATYTDMIDLNLPAPEED